MVDIERSEEDIKAYQELYDSNDPQLRADVLAALKGKHGIDNPDPFHLELALMYGNRDFYDRVHKVSDETIDELKSAIKDSVKELQKEPEYGRSIVVGNILRPIERGWGRYYYNLPLLSEWQVANQPDPKTFSDLLEKGEDPRLVALMMINIYGSKQDFQELASEVGNDVLSWDNKRSLDYRERQANKPDNKNMSDDMRIMPAGLVAIEPYLEVEHDFHYDLYGSTIAEVTSYAIHFVPNDGVSSKDLQKQVENAVNRFVKDGEITFHAPSSEYKKPKNAYKRPKDYNDRMDGELSEYWGNFFACWKIGNDDIVRKHWDFFYDTDEDTNEVFDTGCISGGQIRKWVLEDKFPDDTPEQLIRDIKKATKTVKETCRHSTINDDGHVVLNNTLILDDVLQLYEFCDEFLTPSVKVAQALEAARYAEECSPLKSPGDLGDDYSRDHLRLTDQLGNFEGVAPEQIVDKALHDIMAFYGRTENAQMAFLQAASLAHGTLTGILPDGTGEFPTLKQITDESKTAKSTELTVIAEDSMTDRTGQLLKRAVTLFGDPNSDLPLKEQFADASHSMSELLRYQQKIDDICKHYMRKLKYPAIRKKGNRLHVKFRVNGSTGNMFEEINDAQKTPDDLLASERSHALFCLSAQKLYEPQNDALAIINALEGRDGDSCYWIKKDADRRPKDEKAKDKEPDPSKEFTKETAMPNGLDVLNGYIWRCCKEQIFKKYHEKDPNFLPTVRANIEVHGGVTPPQLPRTFDNTSYTTRPAGTPFPRPNTDLPDELASMLPKRQRERSEHIQLPDPSVVWGKAYKPK